MAEDGAGGRGAAAVPAGAPAGIDTSVAHPARDIVPPDGVSAYGGVARKA